MGAGLAPGWKKQMGELPLAKNYEAEIILAFYA
jgi:hypothetical protein